MSKYFGCLIIGILLLIALLVCGSSLYGQQLSAFSRSLEPSCTVGSASATITVQAWSANSDCQKMLNNQDDFTNVKWGAILMPVSEAGNGAIVCEFDRAGRHITIRDSGASNQGGVLCTMIDQATL